MKKLIFLIIFSLFLQPVVEARDFVKLHLEEMKHAEKYGATDQYFADYSNKEVKKQKIKQENIELKDPKLIKLGGYDDRVIAKYSEKVQKDKIEYAKVKKYLASRKVDNYNSQAYSEDFYILYKVTERIIRANRLDYVNWRLVIDPKREFDANINYLNCVTVNTGLMDTFKGNEDALALVVAHEIAHSMLGHPERLAQIYSKMIQAKNAGVSELYTTYRRKFLINSKNAEYTADVEGAKYLIRAQYDLEKAREVLGVMNNFDFKIDGESTHPNGEKRLKNFEQNKIYFMDEEWKKQGKHNLVEIDVLKCEKSSDRKSIVIVRGKLRDSDDYYRPESIEEIYTRVAYNAYLNKDFRKASKYFKKLAKSNKENITPLLYLSYIEEYKYKKSAKERFLNRANKYIQLASSIDSKNKHVKKQIKDLQETL